MADNDNATRAPESDAQETTIPGDTSAQTGPTMGEHCVTDRPTREPTSDMLLAFGPNH